MERWDEWGENSRKTELKGKRETEGGDDLLKEKKGY